MPTTISFKKGLDRTPWRCEAVAPQPFAAGMAYGMDHRNDIWRTPIVYQLQAVASVYAYNTYSDEFYLTVPFASPALSGVAAGATMIYFSSQGPGVGNNSSNGTSGKISAGNNSSITLSTALPTAVGTNQLANRGDGVGYRMRVLGFGNSISSGKGEEVLITRNTSGTTPVVYFGIALTTGLAANISSGNIISFKNVIPQAPAILPGMTVQNTSNASVITLGTVVAGVNTTAITLSANVIGNLQNTDTILINGLSYTPQNGDGYEIMSGKLYLLGSGAVAAGTFKSIDIATNTITQLANVGLPTIGTDSYFLAMCENYVSNDRDTHDGFIDTGATHNQNLHFCCNVTATNSTSVTLNTLVNPGPSPSLANNEYRNFQLRVVQDITTPTSLGQRRTISFHTSGSTPVMTVTPAWGVTPSTDSKVVVELNNDKIMLRSSATTTCYNYSIGSNAWDSTTWLTSTGTAWGAGGMIAPSWGLTRDPTGSRFQSDLHMFVGGTLATLDIFNFGAAGGSGMAANTGAWSPNVTYWGKGQTFAAGACGTEDIICNGGQYYHISIGGSGTICRMYRYNVLTQTLELGTDLAYFGSTLTTGQRMWMGYSFDGVWPVSDTKIPFVYQQLTSVSQVFSQLHPY